jgi:hypothetical protein
MLSAISELAVSLGVVLTLYVLARLIFRLGWMLLRRGRGLGTGDATER